MKTPTNPPEAQQGKEQTVQVKPQRQPLHPSLPSDEFHGVAGSYLFDPTTGLRTLVREADNS